MSPAALLEVYQTIKHHAPPPCFLLSIQGLSFELGENLSSKATENLSLAITFTQQLLDNSTLDFWYQQAGNNFA
jgi:hypothetical protein